jgi:hypothetical protein
VNVKCFFAISRADIMTSFFKNRSFFFWCTFFVITLLPFGWRLLESDEIFQVKDENFVEEIQRLNSIDKMVAYADSVYALEKVNSLDTVLYVGNLSTVLRNRFCLKPSDYKFSENWIAWLSGKIFWSHFSSIVLPNDIVKHSSGLCSQQTIVFMELLRRKGITVRSVGLGYDEGPGHFLCEVRTGGSWHLYDVSLEPVWSKMVAGHCSLDYYLDRKDSLFVAYESRIPKELFLKIMEKHRYGEVNEMPGKKMFLFHKFTFLLIYLLPLLSLFMMIRTFSRDRKNKNITHSSAAAETKLDPSINHLKEI